MHQTSPSYICLLSSYLPLTQSAPLCTAVFTFSRFVGSTLACVATRTALCAFFLLHPNYYRRTSFFVLAGPGPLHENAVPAVSRSPLGRANTFSFPSLLACPYISKCSSSSTFILSASRSLADILSPGGGVVETHAMLALVIWPLTTHPFRDEAAPLPDP